MADFVTDALEQILIRLDVADLLRCKSVCKSWRSLISDPLFIITHLINCHKNSKTGHMRILVSKHQCEYKLKNNRFVSCYFHLLGSSNGLLCIYIVNVELLVVNMFTGEVRKLPKPVIADIGSSLCWGFGYDSSAADDYKVILGMRVGEDLTRFQLLSLKSNVWKFVGEVKYTVVTRIGTFCNGALHWFMNDENKRKVILSFDLSGEGFKEIPQPSDVRYRYRYDSGLGVINHNLCIFGCLNPAYHKWVMTKYSVQQSWELLPYIHNRDDSNHNVVCYLKDRVPRESSHGDVRIWFSLTLDDVSAPVFVPSLVSPHVHGRLERKRNM